MCTHSRYPVLDCEMCFDARKFVSFASSRLWLESFCCHCGTLFYINRKPSSIHHFFFQCFAWLVAMIKKNREIDLKNHERWMENVSNQMPCNRILWAHFFIQFYEKNLCDLIRMCTILILSFECEMRARFSSWFFISGLDVNQKIPNQKEKLFVNILRSFLIIYSNCCGFGLFCCPFCTIPPPFADNVLHFFVCFLASFPPLQSYHNCEERGPNE